MQARVRYRSRGVPALVASALLFWAMPASGQVTATPRQDLAFGMLVPGTPTTVLVDDVVRRAEWLLTGRGNTTVSLVLPAALTGANGGTIPLQFVDGDAVWMRSNNTNVRAENPNAPFQVTIPNQQSVRLFLGGTARPAASTPAGAYTATITLIVAQP